MINLTDLISQSLTQVWVSFTHNWPFLLASVIISVALRLYMDPAKVSAVLTRYRRVGVIGATAAAVTTPFCSCGTTAVVLGMIASTVPWSPIVAFMVASPLTSPEELIYSAGLFGWPFAIAFFVSSILLGLMGGALAEFFEARGWLANQLRFQQPAVSGAQAAEKETQSAPAAQTIACGCQTERKPAALSNIRSRRPVLAMETGVATAAACCAPAAAVPTATATCGCGSAPAASEPKAAEPVKQAITLRRWMDELFRTGKQLLVMFLGFAFIGYMLNGIIPAEWVSAIFGKGNVYSVPLAATLALPLYINTEGSLPLVRALLEGGMSQGAALAFLITGAGTSVGAVTGALTIARWRVIALVVGTLWAGSIILGFAYDLLLAAHLF